MTDPLTDLLTQGLAHHHGPSYWPGLHDVTIIGETPEDCAVKLLSAIDPAKADAMRAGLLLVEATQAVQRIRQRAWMVEVIDWGYEPGAPNPVTGGATRHKGRWQASAQHSWQLQDEPEWDEIHGSGDSPLAALTDLLSKLRVQP